MAESGDFGDFGGRAWLNAAPQGPMPRVAVHAAHRAAAQKADPRLIDDEVFFEARDDCGAVQVRTVPAPTGAPYPEDLRRALTPGRGWVHLARPHVLDNLEFAQGYWLAQVDEISQPPADYDLRDDLGGAAFDVFCTANLSTFPVWQEALDLLLVLGAARIEDHNQALVQRLIDGLSDGWSLLSPSDRDKRSTLVFLKGATPAQTEQAPRRLKDAGVDVAQRVGAIRISPHLYNTTDDIDRTLQVLSGTDA